MARRSSASLLLFTAALIATNGPIFARAEPVVATPAPKPADDERARAARPTPLTPPSPRKDQRAYQLYWEIDAPVLALAAALAYGRSLRATGTTEPAYCTTLPDGCDSGDLNFIDRPFAGTYDKSWSTASDLAVAAMAVAPSVMLAIDSDIPVALNDSLVIYESALFAFTLSGLSTQATGRARPYVYGDEAPEALRLGGEGALSFFSAHTSFAFALASSTFWTFRRRHPTSAGQWWVLGAGLSAAAFVGIARIEGGNHFPTDVLAGAAVGAGIGTLVPFLHHAPVQVSAAPQDGGAALAVTRRF